MNEIPITAAEVKKIREELNCGLYQAKRTLLRRKAVEILNTANTVEEIKPVLKMLLDEFKTELL